MRKKLPPETVFDIYGEPTILKIWSESEGGYAPDYRWDDYDGPYDRPDTSDPGFPAWRQAKIDAYLNGTELPPPFKQRPPAYSKEFIDAEVTRIKEMMKNYKSDQS